MRKQTVNRDGIITKIVGISEWLEKKAKQKRCVGLPKINAMKGALYGYSIAVRALKDRELDELMERVKRIEENLKIDQR